MGLSVELSFFLVLFFTYVVLVIILWEMNIRNELQLSCMLYVLFVCILCCCIVLCLQPREKWWSLVAINKIKILFDVILQLWWEGICQLMY